MHIQKLNFSRVPKLNVHYFNKFILPGFSPFHIVDVNLNHCANVNDEIMESVAKYVPHLQWFLYFIIFFLISIFSVHFAHTSVTDIGCRKMLHFLKQPHKLQELDACGTQVYEPMTILLLVDLCGNQESELSLLKVTGISFSDSQANQLLQKLRKLNKVCFQC